MNGYNNPNLFRYIASAAPIAAVLFVRGATRNDDPPEEVQYLLLAFFAGIIPIVYLVYVWLRNRSQKIEDFEHRAIQINGLSQLHFLLAVIIGPAPLISGLDVPLLLHLGVASIMSIISYRIIPPNPTVEEWIRAGYNKKKEPNGSFKWVKTQNEKVQ